MCDHYDRYFPEQKDQPDQNKEILTNFVAANKDEPFSEYEWLFRFNPLTNKWYATHRDNYDQLWTNLGSSKVLSSSDPDTLRMIIRKTGGRPHLIFKLLNKQK